MNWPISASFAPTPIFRHCGHFGVVEITTETMLSRQNKMGIVAVAYASG